MKYLYIKYLFYTILALIFLLDTGFLIKAKAQDTTVDSISNFPIIALEVPDNVSRINLDIIAENLTIVDFKPDTQFVIGRCDGTLWFNGTNVCVDMVFQENITDNSEIASVTIKTQTNTPGSIKIKLTYISEDGVEKAYETSHQIGGITNSTLNPTLIIGIASLASILLITFILIKSGKKLNKKYKITIITFLFVIATIASFGNNDIKTLPETGILLLDGKIISKQIATEKGINDVVVTVNSQTGMVSSIVTEGSLLTTSQQKTFASKTADEIASKTLSEYQKYLVSGNKYVSFVKYDSKTDKNGTYTKFRQLISGVPVFESEVVVFIKDSKPKSIIAKLSSIEYIDPKSMISNSEAKDLASYNFNKVYGYQPQEKQDPILWIYDTDISLSDSYQKTLIYSVNVIDKDNPSNYIIDANKGTIISEGTPIMFTVSPDIQLILNITPFCDKGIRYEGYNWYNVYNIVDNYWVDVSTDSNFPSTNSYHKYFPNTSSGGGYIPYGFTKSTNNLVPMQNLLYSTKYYVRVVLPGPSLTSETKSFTSSGTCPTPTPIPGNTTPPVATPTPVVSADAPILYLNIPFCDAGKIYEDITFDGDGYYHNFYIDISQYSSFPTAETIHQFFEYTQSGAARAPISFTKASGGGTADNLIPDTTYFVRVLQTDTGSYSEIKTFTTPSACTIPAPTLTLKTSTCETGKIYKNISFNGSGVVDDFTLYISTDRTFPTNNSFYQYLPSLIRGDVKAPNGFVDYNNQYSMGDLMPATIYFVKVKQEGTGRTSVRKSFTTPAECRSIACNVVLTTTAQCNQTIADIKAAYPRLIQNFPSKNVTCGISSSYPAGSCVSNYLKGTIKCPPGDFVTPKLIFHELAHQYRLSVLALPAGVVLRTGELQASLLEDKMFLNEPGCYGALYVFKGIDGRYRDSNSLINTLTSLGITDEQLWKFALGEVDSLNQYVAGRIGNMTRTADLYRGGPMCFGKNCPAPSATSIALENMLTPESGSSFLNNVVCGPIDVNGDNVLNSVDQAEFMSVYMKSCSDMSPKTGCGGKDTDGNGKIDIVDFQYLSNNFVNKKANCQRY